MNPLFAIGWELFRDFSFANQFVWQDQLSHSFSFLSVYAIAPTLGACLAGLLLRRIRNQSQVRSSFHSPEH
jgi:glycerol uptake facilitator-like aquaporin